MRVSFCAPNARDEYQAAQSRDAKDRGKSNGSRDTEWRTGNEQSQHAAGRAKRKHGQHRQSITDRIERDLEKGENHAHGNRNDDGEPLLFFAQAVVLSGPFVVIAFGQVQGL